MIYLKEVTQENLSLAKALEKELFNQQYLVLFFNTNQPIQGFALAAFNQKECVAVGAIMFAQEHGELLMIGVNPSYQRQKIGQLLLEELINYTKQQNIQRIFLEVRASNQAAIALYKKVGFIINRIRKDYYDNPQEDAWEMRL